MSVADWRNLAGLVLLLEVVLILLPMIVLLGLVIGQTRRLRRGLSRALGRAREASEQARQAAERVTGPLEAMGRWRAGLGRRLGLG